MKKTVIGLVGETGSGKDTVANHLKEKHGAKLLRFADPIKDTLSIFLNKLSKKDHQWLYSVFSDRFGDDVLCRAVKKKIDKEKGPLIVVNGLRMPCDYEFIRNYPNSYLLYVTADPRLRWERVVKRDEKTDDDITFEKFKDLDSRLTEVSIPEIGKKADRMIKNDKDLDHLLEETDKFLQEIIGKEENEGADGDGTSAKEYRKDKGKDKSKDAEEEPIFENKKI